MGPDVADDPHNGVVLRAALQRGKYPDAAPAKSNFFLSML
jgi:hypothetical protein